MATKTQKYAHVYLRLMVGYNKNLSVKINIFGFKESFRGDWG